MQSLVKRIAAGSLAAITLAGVLAVAPAQARDGGAIAAGVVGGLALGAIAGSAAANSGYGYGGPAYGYAPAYAPPPPPPAYGGCYYERQPVVDEYGYTVRYRRVRICE